jgi:hypothetical protein
MFPQLQEEFECYWGALYEITELLSEAREKLA